jgi:hypothetical protein
MQDFNTRDLFAALAMCGWMGSARLHVPINIEFLAKESYEIAEAMIKEKEKRDAE